MGADGGVILIKLKDFENIKDDIKAFVRSYYNSYCWAGSYVDDPEYKDDYLLIGYTGTDCLWKDVTICISFAEFILERKYDNDVGFDYFKMDLETTPDWDSFFEPSAKNLLKIYKDLEKEALISNEPDLWPPKITVNEWALKVIKYGKFLYEETWT